MLVEGVEGDLAALPATFTPFGAGSFFALAGGGTVLAFL